VNFLAESAMFNNFEYFLSRLEISYEEYKFTIRSYLKKPQVFLRRQFSVRLLNAYNINILGLHREKMDIKFILDGYACCSYIINFINKSNRGVSQLLRNKPWKCPSKENCSIWGASLLRLQKYLPKKLHTTL